MTAIGHRIEKMLLLTVSNDFSLQFKLRGTEEVTRILRSLENRGKNTYEKIFGKTTVDVHVPLPQVFSEVLRKHRRP